MTHLYIELNTSGIEEVNSSIISKLYELAISGDLDNTSDLKGRLHLTIGYRQPISYLNNTYQDLYITADDYAIPFEDPNMLQYLLDKGIGSNGMITENQAAAATVVANSTNTTVTKFNELKYFTNITGSNGGFESSSSYGKILFRGWTALEEVDVSNLTYIGHKRNGYNYPYDALDTFDSCSSLKTVTASSNLTKLGYCAFSECSNLEYISGLSGEIELAQSAFWKCKKLENRTFDNCVINLTGGNVFESCETITSLNISQLTTNIKPGCFLNCTNLLIINGGNFSIIDREGCRNCENLVSIDLSNVTTIGQMAFSWCTSLTSVNGNNSTPGVFNLSNVSTLGENAFVHCYGITQITGLDNITTLPSNVFSECINLLSISLPNVTTIGRGVFSYCQRLSNINIDWDNVVSMSTGAFKNCTGPFEYTSNTVIGGVSLFDGCTSATWPLEITLTTDPGHRCFAGCKLNKVIIGPSVHNLCNTCFSNCRQLTEIRGLENITSIGAYMFEECQNLEGVIDLSNVTGYVNNSGLNNNQNSSEGQMFKNCYKITKIIIGSLPQIEVLDDKTPFRNNSMLEVVDISSLGHITITNGRTLFTNCPRLHSFILRSQTVVPLYAPSGYDYTFDLGSISDLSTIRVYVPDSLVNDYKQSSKWADILSCIYPISQFEIDHPTNTTT